MFCEAIWNFISIVRMNQFGAAVYVYLIKYAGSINE